MLTKKPTSLGAIMEHLRSSQSSPLQDVAVHCPWASAKQKKSATALTILNLTVVKMSYKN
jgi:hypothetical protein